ncbi:zinc finger protein 182-like [Armigeres subalbatus]|uniref:zinc finger protein 182-like n=1 Tax=Armigeres subalbatus TaxID=124917 RepID=UPI002ED12103
MDPNKDFTLGNLEPLVNPVRQYRNRKQKKQHQEQWKSDEQKEQNKASTGSATGDSKLADVLSKITSLNKTAEKVDRTKLIRTYNVKLRLKKPCLYKCFDCDVCFTNADFLELHEKSHSGAPGAADGSGTARNEIDLQQEQSFDESEMIVKQNAWFVGDFDESEDQNGDNGEDDDGTIQLDCTVEEREDNFDITFDRTKCAKTYTVVKYKVKKDPVGKCEMCERLFYTMESLQLHRMEHERFLDFDSIEPQINIDSPSIEESTLVLDESFYHGETEDSDILEASDSALDVGRLEPARLEGLRNGEWKPAPRRGSPPYRIPPREPVPPTIEGRYQCEVCSRRFRFRPAYNVHLRTHDNSRPFQCGECNRRFVSRAKLFLHSYGHARDRRAALQCNVCGTTFGRPRQLLEHMQQEHDVAEAAGAVVAETTGSV